MSDTQWPRYEVFVQEKLGKPYQEYGSVHAPDPEMAIFNARDVFARRPDCIAMWVVPAAAIFSRTQEQIAAGGLPVEQEEAGSAAEAKLAEAYFVACKPRAAGLLEVAGSVQASSPETAMRIGVERFGVEKAAGGRPPFVWWVFPERMVTMSDLEDAESYYHPAKDKAFRLSSDFHTISSMRSLRQAEQARSQSRQEGTNRDAVKMEAPNEKEGDDFCGI